MISIGEKCIGCHKDTSFGTGLFVNRIPADDGVYVGYMCVECLQEKCHFCDDYTSDFSIDREGNIVCGDCDVQVCEECEKSYLTDELEETYICLECRAQ